MKRTLIVMASIVVFISSFALTSPAFATVPPSLQLSATGNSDAVQVMVQGDPNASVLLSYTEAGSGPTIASLGNTDSNGNLTTTISSASYGLTSGILVTALVGGTGGAKSPTLSWPIVVSASSLTLSQNAAVVNVGASVSLTATNAGSGTLYVSNNSNPAIANVSISGSQITISGNTTGSTTVTLCTVGSSSSCPSVSVMILPAGTVPLSFSQNNPTIVSGQNLPITTSGGSGTYAILSNSNTSVIQASLSGSVLTLSTGVSTGSSSITVCSTDSAVCGVIVASAGNVSSAPVSFSTTAPSVAMNQSTSVYVYGPTGVSFYVSANSNPSIVQANLTGTTLTLTGIAQGSSNITVCASTGTCAAVTATITSSAPVANISISQSTLSLQAGQSATITITGGNQPYQISGGTSSVTTETVNGSSLNVYGVGAGSSMIWVCENVGSACTGLSVTVNGPGMTTVTPPVNTTTVVSPTVTPSSSNLSQSQIAAIISLLQSFGADQTTITSTEAALGGQTMATIASTPTSVSVSSTGYVFSSFLHLASQGAEVTELQKHLAATGFFSGSATGYFGPLTQAAVKKFQAAHALAQAGYVGPGTRAVLNE